MLAKVGGFDIAGLCGVFLGGALYRVPVLADGFISTVAALCAVRLCPLAEQAVFASHVSAEPAGALVLNALGQKPLITAEMRLGEGTGAVAAIPLLDMALAVYGEAYTFEQGASAPMCPGRIRKWLHWSLAGGQREEPVRRRPGAGRRGLAPVLHRHHAAFDGECRARIQRHRAMRAQKGFETIERYTASPGSRCPGRAPSCWSA